MDNKFEDIDWFDKILTVSGTYLPEIRREVKEMINEYDLKHGGTKPHKYIAYAIGSKLIKNAAIKAGGIGGLTSIPATLPVVGTIGTVLIGSAVDLALVLRMQIELCYALSVAYDVNMDEEELKAAALALVGFSGSAAAAKAVTAGVLRKTVDTLASDYIKTGLARAAAEVAEKLIPRLLSKWYKFIPLLGIPIGVSVNAATTMMIGNQARKYFSTWVDDDELGRYESEL
ncbi:EcsC family protein [Candidatus Magnetominusculus xianensis]|uniref:Magnetosome protein Mad31 n=1 Tax=Candidatus Magnetominusculus xianensis TaxID=1748249 RepID=A0ABR5SKQ2_9BACT|nr:EcsC family protein [Candidatus Magnetominusculus xianensis]KWT94832.1 magnetosome protein Mad31 [Candidatus Magnetominusculus xianensis]MBF0404724.1 EcsC family protein [Nitrospirota bacterium]